MSEASEQNPTPAPEDNSEQFSTMALDAEGESEGGKKMSKKEAAKLDRLRKKQELKAAAAANSGAAAPASEDPLAANYGDVPLNELQSKAVTGRKWTEVGKLEAGFEGQVVLFRGRLQAKRGKGKLAFLVVRERGFTVQCVLNVKPDVVSPQMVKYATALSTESIIDVEGVVSVPKVPVESTTQKVEVHVTKIYAISNAEPVLPVNIDDAARSETEIVKAEQAGEPVIRVNQDTRLNNRVLDLRTPANQAIFRLQSEVGMFFEQYLRAKDFIALHTPKLMPGSSEGGSAVFKLDYMGTPACLAQSPQLHKQMAICADFGRVYEIGPVFRAERSFTHRHLCEFVGLDVEMEIKEHYSEVMDIVGELFVSMFDSLNKNCQKQLEAINRQYPFKPLKYLPKTLRLTFEEGIKMLEEAGVNVDPLCDLNTENERKLGELVKEKYDTEFYILHRYPLAVRPFYTMPCYDNPTYSNSFDVFIRGEEIISGAQRVHEAQLLEKRARELGIDVKTISTYIDAFRYGAPPHGGFGVGLERVVMLFCALNNIRKTSLFPRDPNRLAP
ncbi:OLC1v1004585C1 [Oldenlandia corymbosa var. corymbosa]|uniref:aspartate--tRNA ligase n=1 Tax=Oldenlandia corymbosa var. corymbosa TaxID=529605 RepID=A0AAV1DDC2_OLDCO|nr:OLC1v1004585C1 [Oldenlandia corymbosa var. corymbosa]